MGSFIENRPVFSIKQHSLIVALIKLPWWKTLCYLCLYNKKKTCQNATCISLLWVATYFVTSDAHKIWDKCPRHLISRLGYDEVWMSNIEYLFQFVSYIFFFNWSKQISHCQETTFITIRRIFLSFEQLKEIKENIQYSNFVNCTH